MTSRIARGYGVATRAEARRRRAIARDAKIENKKRGVRVPRAIGHASSRLGVPLRARPTLLYDSVRRRNTGCKKKGGEREEGGVSARDRTPSRRGDN